ncbi:hypothetical protein N8D56_22810 [Devosia sp. A8/3-2]|nr:hypothetical protein N8D56_22810 [Devosia sp. A8/3-2]
MAPDATATVEIMIEPVFDCSEIIGRVFDDSNRNGYRDEGELGLPGVRLATVKGWLVTTDAHGRFHVACAALPDQRIGSNFIMKLDPRTLPSGYRLTTENPRVVRLTAGKMTALDFGVAIGRVVRLDLQDRAFELGSTELRQQWAAGVDQLIGVLDEEQSVLRLSYIDPGADPELAEDRLRQVSELIRALGAPVGAIPLGYRNARGDGTMTRGTSMTTFLSLRHVLLSASTALTANVWLLAPAFSRAGPDTPGKVAHNSATGSLPIRGKYRGGNAGRYGQHSLHDQRRRPDRRRKRQDPAGRCPAPDRSGAAGGGHPGQVRWPRSQAAAQCPGAAQRRAGQLRDGVQLSRLHCPLRDSYSGGSQLAGPASGRHPAGRHQWHGQLDAAG